MTFCMFCLDCHGAMVGSRRSLVHNTLAGHLHCFVYLLYLYPIKYQRFNIEFSIPKCYITRILCLKYVMNTVLTSGGWEGRGRQRGYIPRPNPHPTPRPISFTPFWHLGPYSGQIL